jgi:hypothetical protein
MWSFIRRLRPTLSGALTLGLLASLLVLGPSRSVRAEELGFGALDPSFGTNGSVVIPQGLSIVASSGNAITHSPPGSLFFSGGILNSNGTVSLQVGNLNSHGTLNTFWGTGGLEDVSWGLASSTRAPTTVCSTWVVAT